MTSSFLKFIFILDTNYQQAKRRRTTGAQDNVSYAPGTLFLGDRKRLKTRHLMCFGAISMFFYLYFHLY